MSAIQCQQAPPETVVQRLEQNQWQDFDGLRQSLNHCIEAAKTNDRQIINFRFGQFHEKYGSDCGTIDASPAGMERMKGLAQSVAALQSRHAAPTQEWSVPHDMPAYPGAQGNAATTNASDIAQQARQMLKEMTAEGPRQWSTTHLQVLNAWVSACQRQKNSPENFEAMARLFNNDYGHSLGIMSLETLPLFTELSRQIAMGASPKPRATQASQEAQDAKAMPANSAGANSTVPSLPEPKRVSINTDTDINRVISLFTLNGFSDEQLATLSADIEFMRDEDISEAYFKGKYGGLFHFGETIEDSKWSELSRKLAEIANERAE